MGLKDTLVMLVGVSYWAVIRTHDILVDTITP